MLWGALVALALLVAPAAANAARIRYTVAPGDTLGSIAAAHGVSVADIRRWNSMRSDRIRDGQVLTINTRGRGSAERVRETYTVRSGDSGIAIARRLRVSYADLQRWNRSRDLNRLRPGDRIYYYVESGGAESTGLPNRGRLVTPTLLEGGNGFRVRDAERAWGTAATVASLSTELSNVQAHFIDAPSVIVHDLSFQRGGRMRPHSSHQNGLDADVSYFRRDCDDHCGWQAVSAEELDVERQFYLFRRWMEQGAVEYIFSDRRLIEVLRAYAEERGASEAQLREWFASTPGGRGIIRHEPGHVDHFHVRFVQ